MVSAKVFGVKVRCLASAIACTFTLGFSPQAQAQDWWGKALDAYFFDSRACAFFSLAGVVEADPVVPGSSYFALSKSNPNYAEMNALLMSAKAGRIQVDVKTNGAIVCGQAEVIFVGLR